jgi:hypothetical protein
MDAMDCPSHFDNNVLIDSIKNHNDTTTRILVENDKTDNHEPDNLPLRVAIHEKYRYGVELLLEDDWVYRDVNNLESEELEQLYEMGFEID